MQMGFAYIVSVVSLFDEYVNDLLYLREGSCLPRCYYQLFFIAAIYSGLIYKQKTHFLCSLNN